MEKVLRALAGEFKAMGERTLAFVASDESKDRDGEVVKADGWELKNYRKNPVVLLNHAMHTLPIGKAKVKIKDKALLTEITFASAEENPQADLAFRLAKGGFLNALSVGFMPREWVDGDGAKTPRRTYTKQELYEISVVTVPANPQALRRAVEAGAITQAEAKSFAPEPASDDALDTHDGNIAALVNEIKALVHGLAELCELHKSTINSHNEHGDNDPPEPEAASGPVDYIKALLSGDSVPPGDEHQGESTKDQAQGEDGLDSSFLDAAKYLKAERDKPDGR